MDHVHIEEQIRPFKAKDLWHLLMTLREEKIARVLKIVEMRLLLLPVSHNKYI